MHTVLSSNWCSKKPRNSQGQGAEMLPATEIPHMLRVTLQRFYSTVLYSSARLASLLTLHSARTVRCANSTNPVSEPPHDPDGSPRPHSQLLNMLSMTTPDATLPTSLLSTKAGKNPKNQAFEYLQYLLQCPTPHAPY
jgi:hypothetical protein